MFLSCSLRRRSRHMPGHDRRRQHDGKCLDAAAAGGGGDDDDDDDDGDVRCPSSVSSPWRGGSETTPGPHACRARSRHSVFRAPASPAWRCCCRLASRRPTAGCWLSSVVACRRCWRLDRHRRRPYWDLYTFYTARFLFITQPIPQLRLIIRLHACPCAGFHRSHLPWRPTTIPLWCLKTKTANKMAVNILAKKKLSKEEF